MTQPQKRKPNKNTLRSLDYNKMSIGEVKKHATYYTQELNKIRKTVPGLVPELNVPAGIPTQRLGNNYQMPIPTNHDMGSRFNNTASYQPQQEAILSGSQFGNDAGDIIFRPVEPRAEIMSQPLIEDNSAELETELKDMLTVKDGE